MSYGMSIISYKHKNRVSTKNFILEKYKKNKKIQCHVKIIMLRKQNNLYIQCHIENNIKKMKEK